MSDDLHPELTEDQRAAAEADQRMNRLFRNVFSSPEGIEVLAYIELNFCHYFSMLDSGDSYKAGQRDIGLAILERVCLSGLEAKDIIQLILSVPQSKE